MGNKRYLRGSTEQCPKCGCRKVFVAEGITFKGYGPDIATCKNCDAIWEPFDPAQIWNKDDPVCSFIDPCNNCAFRPGSNEQQNREEWIKMIGSLREGAAFYCHKGVPIEANAEHGFAYPEHDQTKLRLCRGYLNALYGLRKRDFEQDTKPESAALGSVSDGSENDG